MRWAPGQVHMVCESNSIGVARCDSLLRGLTRPAAVLRSTDIDCALFRSKVAETGPSRRL